jgi:hypothetical protein
MATSAPIISDAVQRLRRVMQIGNPVTIKMAERDLIDLIPRLRPVDLVNSLKIAGYERQNVSKTVIQECLKRNLRGFIGQDLAVLVRSIDDSSPELVSKICEKFIHHEFIRSMRTSDLCMCMLGVAKKNNVPQFPNILVTCMREFVKGERIKQFNEINVSQVLTSLNTKGSLDAIQQLGPLKESSDTVNEFLQQFMKKIEKEIHTYSDKTLAFALYAMVQIFQAIRIPLDDPHRLKFLKRMAQEVERRESLGDIHLVTCVRALGRARVLDKDFVQKRVQPKLHSIQLTEAQQAGLNTALASVGLGSS